MLHLSQYSCKFPHCRSTLTHWEMREWNAKHVWKIHIFEQRTETRIELTELCYFIEEKQIIHSSDGIILQHYQNHELCRGPRLVVIIKSIVFTRNAFNMLCWCCMSFRIYLNVFYHFIAKFFSKRQSSEMTSSHLQRTQTHHVRSTIHSWNMVKSRDSLPIHRKFDDERKILFDKLCNL